MKFALLLVLGVATQAYAADPIKPCASNQLSLATDAENGNFDGMSHSGTLLILRNIGPTPCSAPPFPAITFKDAQGRTLDISGTVQGSRFMHPGPVVLPPIVAPGAELTSTLIWVSGDVFDHGTCAHPTTLSMMIGTESQTIPFQATICGQTKPTYTMTRLLPDPIYKPAQK